ncbi:hypothetical protein P7C71_g6428, partial [Lecanoromycetidae sp. Uapishka_2]
MPAFKWNAENNAKLSQILVAGYVGTPDYKMIAAAFGPEVKDRAIQYRIGQLRQEGVALGFGPGTTGKVIPNAPKTISRAPARAKKGNTPNGKVRKRGGILSDTLSDEESMADTGNDSEQEATPPDTDDNVAPITPTNKRQKTIGGRVVKRASPRKTAKKDYKALEDPYARMADTTDGDGEKVFETEKSDSEDSYASDATFGKEDNAVVVKTEELVTEEAV